MLMYAYAELEIRGIWSVILIILDLDPISWSIHILFLVYLHTASMQMHIAISDFFF